MAGRRARQHRRHPGRRAPHHPRHAKRRGPIRWGRAAALSAAFVVLAGTGAGIWAYRDLHGVPTSDALGQSAPKSSNGAQNILLVGLDSRKDLHGNALPKDVLDKLHAGSSSFGRQKIKEAYGLAKAHEA